MLEFLRKKKPPILLLYLEMAPGTGYFKKRGVMDKNSRPIGFARLMARGNLRTLVSAADEGPIFEPDAERLERLLIDPHDE